MSLKNCVQKQTAVYWAPLSTESAGRAFDKYGNPKYSDPVEKDCRWEDDAVIFVGPGGTQETSRSVVMIDGVLTGGLLMLGTTDDITDVDNPRNNTGAWEIRQVEKIPDRKAQITYTWCYL